MTNASPASDACSPEVSVRQSIFLAVAVAAGALGNTAMAQEYPDLSRRLDEEGDVTVAYKVKDGRLFDCRVAVSSGFPRLDEISCPLVELPRNAPVYTDDSGNMERRRTIQWRLPPNAETMRDLTSGDFPMRLPDASRGVNVAVAGELPSGRRANLGLYIKVGTDGSVKSCSVKLGSGIRKLDKRACEIASGWRYQPVQRNGVAISSAIPETFYWAAPDAPKSLYGTRTN